MKITLGWVRASAGGDPVLASFYTDRDPGIPGYYYDDILGIMQESDTATFREMELEVPDEVIRSMFSPVLVQDGVRISTVGLSETTEIEVHEEGPEGSSAE